ncbi:MAG: DUF393 domain-containing protein [Hyphomicrobiaceae bacterium]|nr:DUF393 domain-containing protein [Hyphomicrobiaceae bacterium]
MSDKSACERTQVFFDGSCPLCRREISVYRDLRGAELIDWVDVSAFSHPAEEVAPGLEKRDAMARFHVKGADGRLRSGALAFAQLWSELPALRHVGRLARLPGVHHVLEIGYRLFLPMRPLIQRQAKRAEVQGRGQ